MVKRIIIFFSIMFIAVNLYAEKDDSIIGKKIIATPLPKKPIAVRASEARKKKVYDFKQHYMRPKQNASGGAGNTLEKQIRTKTIKPRIAVARFGDIKNINNNPFSALIGDTKIDRDTNTIITGNRDIEPYKGFTEDIISALMETDKFIVVERKDITKLLREQGFQATGFVENITDKTFSAITGVDYIVNGAVSVDENEKRVVNLRIYDVYLGNIVASKRIVADSKWDAVQMAVQHIAEKVVPKKWQLKVSNVKGKNLYLNAGKNVGLKGGQKYEVYSIGDKVYDPDTNEPLAVEEEKIALVKIGGVNNSYSTATVIEQTKPIKIGDILKPYKGVYFEGESINEAEVLKATKKEAKSVMPTTNSGVANSNGLISNLTSPSHITTSSKQSGVETIKQVTSIAGDTIKAMQEVRSASGNSSEGLNKVATVVQTITSAIEKS